MAGAPVLHDEGLSRLWAALVDDDGERATRSAPDRPVRVRRLPTCDRAVRSSCDGGWRNHAG